MNQQALLERVREAVVDDCPQIYSVDVRTIVTATCRELGRYSVAGGGRGFSEVMEFLERLHVQSKGE